MGAHGYTLLKVLALPPDMLMLLGAQPGSLGAAAAPLLAATEPLLRFLRPCSDLQ
jgi:hypothetical protein